IFAVPGNILDGKSEGCLQLIKEGATCVTSGMDILSEY
ncbi:TPA: DNA processing protein DprA, partial [Streptococcus pyogenes]|nr:DNA processing protein DprA [Streptococcus pyogenes]